MALLGPFVIAFVRAAADRVDDLRILAVSAALRGDEGLAAAREPAPTGERARAFSR
jgi:hypothetical protein